MSDPTQYLHTTPTPPHGGRPRPTDRRWKLLAVLALVVLLLGALLTAVTGAGNGTAEATGATDAASVHSTSTTTADGGEVGATDESDTTDEATEAALEADDDSTGYPDSGQNVSEPPSSDEGDGPVELDPVDNGDQACAQVLATGAALLVTPDPAVFDTRDDELGADHPQLR